MSNWPYQTPPQQPTNQTSEKRKTEKNTQNQMLILRDMWLLFVMPLQHIIHEPSFFYPILLSTLSLPINPTQHNKRNRRRKDVTCTNVITERITIRATIVKTTIKRYIRDEERERERMREGQKRALWGQQKGEKIYRLNNHQTDDDHQHPKKGKKKPNTRSQNRNRWQGKYYLKCEERIMIWGHQEIKMEWNGLSSDHHEWWRWHSRRIFQ